MIRSARLASLVGVVLTLGACMPSPTLVPPPVTAATPVDTSAHSTVKPYAEVITKEAKSRPGMFTVHRVADKLYFEIPRRELGRDMLVVGRYARTAAIDASNPFGAYGGDEFGERTVRWERSGDRVILRSPSFAIMADTALPIYRAVAADSYAPIIAVFDVAAYGKDSAAVIDVTRLYTTDVPEFQAFRGSIDEKRSFIERAIAFPDNVEIESTETGTPENAAPFPGGVGHTRADGAQSVVAHWSMVRLPEQPMLPRLGDDRVGFFGVTRTDYGANEPRSVERTFIARWRLECSAQRVGNLCVPKKPITYYIDPATPDQYKPWVRRAVLEWEPAFEAAGFKDAIVVADPPANDPDWSPDDVRHTVIRWLPSTTENAVGPHISDPRTGEILNGSIRLYHNVLNLQRDWYFTQVAPLDARARRWPMPDSLMGRLLQYVVAHEIGHTLGLAHNFKASSTYPADSIRSRTWVHRMGHTPSIMDYARFNYVAQPEDSIALDDLIPRVGPYDTFAITWGYRPVTGATSPLAERPVMDSIARMQDSVPWFRFGNLAESSLDDPDPGDEAEAVGDADAVKSTAAGLRNIARIVPMLIPTAVRPHENNADLDEIYDRLVGQWTTELSHVVNVVGGETSQTKYGSQPGPVFTPVPPARQREAVAFLNAHAFRTPTYLLDQQITRRIEAEGSLSRVGAAQQRLLNALLDRDRMTRMMELETNAGDRRTVYPLSEMLPDLRHGLWSELADTHVAVDGYRRNVQRMYLERLDQLVNNKITSASIIIFNGNGTIRPPAANVPSDVRALGRAELVALRHDIDGAIPRAADVATRAHLLDSRTVIDRILDPNR